MESNLHRFGGKEGVHSSNPHLGRGRVPNGDTDARRPGSDSYSRELPKCRFVDIRLRDSHS